MADARWLWESSSIGARVTRAALLPAGVLFRAATTIRGRLYDQGLLPVRSLGVATVSVGNLTVGGTGKTPVSSWLATQFAERGSKPAILLRGYGDDEVLVHCLLAPNVLVVPDHDRMRGATAAIAGGANVLILDDAFQHRRAARDADVVLVSADAAGAAAWPLPAGPWREPMRALRRATMVLVTAKAASEREISGTVDAIHAAAPGVQVHVVRLEADVLVRWAGEERMSLASARGQRVMAISAIGDPQAFEAQLAHAGFVVTAARYRDHYPFRPADAVVLAARAAEFDMAVCTLKDAVKLGRLWPPGQRPLWYLSQRVTVEREADVVTELASRLRSTLGGPATRHAPRT